MKSWIIPSVPHVTKDSWKKLFVIPFRVTKITKVFYLKSLELYGSRRIRKTGIFINGSNTDNDCSIRVATSIICAIFPIMLALCLMISVAQYAQNYAGIISCMVPRYAVLKLASHDTFLSRNPIGSLSSYAVHRPDIHSMIVILVT